MKKIILLSVFLGLAVPYANSQTYYYQSVASIDKHGVKSKIVGGMYITFINDKNVCYVSDKDGYRNDYYIGYNISSRELAYYYTKTQNGTYVYQQKYVSMSSNYSSWWNFFYYFSSDFSKMTSYSSSYGIENRIEYKRTNGPEDVYDDNIPTF